MEIGSTFPWVALVITGIGSFFVSLVQASVSSVRRERLQWLVAQEIKGAIVLEGLYSDTVGPKGHLSLLRYLLTVAILISAFCLVVAYDIRSPVFFFIVGISVLFVIAISHVAASAISHIAGEKLALKCAGFVRVIARSFTSIFQLETALASFISGYRKIQDENLITNTDSELGIGINVENDSLDEHEARMIRGVVQLDNTTAREIMVPRVDIISVETTLPVKEVVKVMLDSGHSRIPVISTTDTDKVEGIAYSRDILGLLNSSEGTADTSIQDIMRPAVFIPEYKTLEGLLNEFQVRQVQIAIVVDEYGGIAGLVTVEDLLEEIVGEIADEFDTNEPSVENIMQGKFLVDASISLDDVNDLVSTQIEGDGFDTLGGLIYHQLGRIPTVGDFVEYQGIRIEVIGTLGRRIKKLRIEKMASDTRYD